VSVAVTYASVNVSGGRLEYVNGQHNWLANGEQNANVRVDMVN